MPSLVDVADFPATGRGCRCIRAVSAGEELLAVPLDRCFYAAGARQALQPLLANAQVSDHDITALHFLLERAKGAASARAEHIRELPASYDTTLFWSDAEVAQLEGSAWHELATRYSAEAAGDWRALQAVLKATAAGAALDACINNA